MPLSSLCCLLTTALLAAADGDGYQANRAAYLEVAEPPRQVIPAQMIFAPSDQAPPLPAADARRIGDEAEQVRNQALPLAPPRSRDRQGAVRDQPRGLAGAAASMIGGLAIVLGLLLVLVWLVRRAQPAANTLLPGEVVRTLGRATLAPRQQMHVVRFGGKLVLVCVTPGGTEPLSEITDPAEVERLSGICQQVQPGSVSGAFRQVLQQLGREPAQGGFLGLEPAADRGSVEAARSGPRPLGRRAP